MSTENTLVTETTPVNEENVLVIDRDATKLKELCEKDIAKAVQKAHKDMQLQEGEAPYPYDWDVWALGPYQSADEGPGRIIRLGQKAYVVTVVWLNKRMNRNVTDFRGKVQLNYYTSNVQTMTPVEDMFDSCCFDLDPKKTDRFGAFYVQVWELEPTEAGCILETNICARICSCENTAVPGYAAFVRWIHNADFDNFFPPVYSTFDHPLRYSVYDDGEHTNCDCAQDC